MHSIYLMVFDVFSLRTTNILIGWKSGLGTGHSICLISIYSLWNLKDKGLLLLDKIQFSQFHNPEFASIVTDKPKLLRTKSTISIFWVLIDTYLNISTAPFFQAGQMRRNQLWLSNFLLIFCPVEAKLNKTRRRLNSYDINSFYIITYILWAILSQGCFKQ